MRGALHGLRVLDLSRLLPGPLCTAILAAYGADVTKVEDPHRGDWAKTVPPLFGGANLTYTNVNRGKRIIELDLKSEPDRERFWELVDASDALVQSFRPGVVRRLGIDYAAVRERNPRLVYVSLSAFGEEGELAGRAGHDLNCLALAGLLDLNRDDRGRPVIPGVQISDLSIALWGVVGVLLALAQRQRTGRGCHLELSLLGVSLSWLVGELHRLGTGAGAAEAAFPVPGFLGGALACYNLYPVKGGRFAALCALEPHSWREVCLRLGREEWIDWQFLPEKQGEMIRALGETFSAAPWEHWGQVLGEQVAFSPVLSVEEVAAHPAPASTGVLEKTALAPGLEVYQVAWGACVRAAE
ncbi:MAG: CoA transferase [Clostridia bacterium]|nr:CoA transferase [Clostridia bacterium]